MTIKNDRMHLVAGGIIGLLCFFAVFDPRILNPLEIGWVSVDDMSQHFIGWHFFRHESWSWPPGLIDNYANGLQATIALTDSIPLVAFFLKPFSALLPDYFNYLGLWIALSFGLQGLFAARILRQLGLSRWQAGLGASLVCAMPFMMHRATLHIALSSQWVILAGISVYLDSARTADLFRRWTILLPLSVLIHPYLFAMNLFLFAASSVVYAGGTDMKKIRSWWMLAEAPLVALLAIYLMGYLSLLGEDGVASGYGSLQMNLLAWFNSQGLSRVLPSIPVAEVGQTDGLNYLGIGGLLILVLALILLPFSRLNSPVTIFPLLLAALLMMLFAISNRIAVGPYFLAELPIPGWLYHGASMFRASGRFAWTMSYLLVIGAILILSRGRPKGLFLIVPLAAALNLYETKPITERGSSLVDQRGNRDYPPCEQLPANYSKVVFVPAVALEDQSMHEAWPVLLCAGLAGKPVNVGYLSRRSWQRFESNARSVESVLRDGPADGVVYAFRNPASPMLMALEEKNIGKMGGYFIYPMASSSEPGQGIAAMASWRQAWSWPLQITMGVEGEGRHTLLSGWDSPHWGAVLSKGRSARLLLPILQGSDNDPKLTRLTFLAQGLPLQGEGYDVITKVNGIELKPLKLRPENGAAWYSLLLPAEVMASGEPALLVQFDVPEIGDISTEVNTAKRQIWLSKIAVNTVPNDVLRIEPRAGHPSLSYLQSGWYAAESSGTWSQGSVASMQLPVPGGGPAALKLRVFGLASGPEGQQVITVGVNGVAITRWRFPSLAAAEWKSVEIPADIVTSNSLELTLGVEWPAPPVIPGSTDQRLLGIRLSTLELIREPWANHRSNQ